MSKFLISGSPLLAVFTSCQGVPILQEWWFTRVHLEFATRVRCRLLSTYASREDVPCEESTVPSPSSWSHSFGETPSDTIRHNMYLGQHRGTPGFYLPVYCTRRESWVGPDFDPPSRVLPPKLCSDVWLSSLSL